MSKKKFVYLVQGESKLVRKFMPLQDRVESDLVVLTYDKEVDDCVYYPNSTWAEGRNYLLQKAQEKGDYLYYIFCDDDISFEDGGFEEFERSLIRYNPSIAIPVVTMLLNTRVACFEDSVQAFFGNDEPLMAFHKDVVTQGIVVPYQTRFDSLSWWASCTIQQILIQTFYKYSVLQFNNVVVDNNEHGRYENSGYGPRIYPSVVRAWLRRQLKVNYVETNREKAFFKLFLVTMLVKINCKFKRSRFVKNRELEKKISENSIFYKFV